MKVTCTKCSNSWELTNDEIPGGTGPFQVVCGQCGESVEVNRDAGLQWYVAFGRERKGPFNADAVKKMIAAGEIQAGGFVWRQGFESWTKVSDVAEFAGSFAGSAASGSAGGSQGGEGDDGMVWQRRETSVLFSLDDYKQRKATRGTAAVKESEVVDVRPLDEEPAPLRSASSAYGASGIGMISFDETDVQRVADVLARKNKARRRVLSAVIAVAVLVLIGVGAFVASQLISPPDKKSISQAPVVAAVPVQNAAQPAVADKVAEQAAPGGAADKGQAVSAQQVQAPGNKGVEPAKTEAAPVQDDKQKTDKQDAKTAKDAKAEAKAAKEAAKATKEAAKTEKQGDAEPAKPKQEEKQVAKQAPLPGGNDASSLLAQLHKGKGGDAKEEKADAGGGSGLPERLTVAQVSGSFGKKKDAFRSCVIDAGEELPFKAQAKVEIEGSGRVAGVSLAGAGASRGCLEGALRAVTFDKFSGPNMKVPYTVSVR